MVGIPADHYPAGYTFMKDLSPIKQRMLKSAVHIGQHDPEKHEFTY